MNNEHIEGLIAATFTPMKADGSLDLAKVPDIAARMISNNIQGVFVCGSTGEGPSLTTAERKILAEAFVKAADKQLKIFVHVGHNSIAEARALAAHAQRIGADYVSATPPSYFKINAVSALINCLAEIAAGAPELPFYYYNIPSLTGVALDMNEVLREAREKLPTLAGIKYTTPFIHEYQACLNFNNQEYDILYGTDEMLLSALAVGARGFIGSTYNFAAPLYNKLISALNDNDLQTAQDLQMRSVNMVRIINKYGGLTAQKAMMKLAGMDCGPVRLPLSQLPPEVIKQMEMDLHAIGFFDWCSK